MLILSGKGERKLNNSVVVLFHTIATVLTFLTLFQVLCDDKESNYERILDICVNNNNNNVCIHSYDYFVSTLIEYVCMNN